MTKPARRRWWFDTDKELEEVDAKGGYNSGAREFIQAIPGDVILSREDAEKILETIRFAKKHAEYGYILRRIYDDQEILEEAMKVKKV